MTLDNIQEMLKQFGWEYSISKNQTVIYSSKNYFKMKKDNVYPNIYKYQNNYFKNKVKNITINNENYLIEYLEDISNYIELILNLKQDEMTGLNTRNELERYTNELNKVCTVVMIDIDNFKSVNDIYGHQTGDKVLNLLGTIIRKNIRKNDFAAHYGGEELLIIFDTANTKLVKKRIDHINKIFHSCYKELNLSFSAGISLFNNNEEKIEDCIKKADQALYYVKENEKNNSVIYDSNIKKGEMKI